MWTHHVNPWKALVIHRLSGLPQGWAPDKDIFSTTSCQWISPPHGVFCVCFWCVSPIFGWGWKNTLWYFVTWLAYAHFSIGNTSTQSGSIFQLQYVSLPECKWILIMWNLLLRASWKRDTSPTKNRIFFFSSGSRSFLARLRCVWATVLFVGEKQKQYLDVHGSDLN